jgi:hypothetical protein
VFMQYFSVVANENKLTIIKKSKFVSVNQISIFVDHSYTGSMSHTDTIVLSTHGYQPRIVQIQANLLVNGQPIKHHETHIVKQPAYREPSYKPGDILVSCDNVNGLPYGYMGHGAMAIDDQQAIEVAPDDPIVRIIPIDSFKKDHPIHAQFRPVSEQMGQNAVTYALQYMKVFEENKKNGINKPIFHFSLDTPLYDEWTYIYCTKLIWLSYYYGSSYQFINDHLWFSPEDVYSNCINNPYFQLIYIHPNFKFYIDS